MSWQPNLEERRYVECAFAMACDSVLGRGVVDRATFVANLRAIADGLEQLPDPNRSAGSTADPTS